MIKPKKKLLKKRKEEKNKNELKEQVLVGAGEDMTPEVAEQPLQDHVDKRIKDGVILLLVLQQRQRLRQVLLKEA